MIESRRGSRRAVLRSAVAGLLVVGGAGFASLVVAPPAAALPTPSCSSGKCILTYTAPSSPTDNTQDFTVPDGVSSIHVTLYGAEGGAGDGGASGGTEAEVSATVAVTSHERVEIDVGGLGASYPSTTGGVNGGGTGGSGGGGGGGASDLSANGTILVVAGGGGGGGVSGSAGDCSGTPSGGSGGNADSAGIAGGMVSSSYQELSGGGGGKVGDTSNGGGGGSEGTAFDVNRDCQDTGGTSSAGSAGGSGALASGTTIGSGGTGVDDAGGGGGGFAGGGGGGEGAHDSESALAGGGGGGGGLSSGSGSGLSGYTLVSDHPTNPNSGNGEVLITYALTCTWTGAASSDWSVGANWDCNGGSGPPVAGEAVVFPPAVPTNRASVCYDSGVTSPVDLDTITFDNAYSIVTSGPGCTGSTSRLGLDPGTGGTGVTVSGSSVTASIAAPLELATGGIQLFDVAGGDTLAVSGAITGSATGDALQVNDGTLTGQVTLSGANTYSGGTTVSSGALEVTGSSGGGLVVDAATLAPGTPEGTLGVNGSLTLGATSTLSVKLTAPTAGSFSQLSVTGNASRVTLGSSTLSVNLSGYRGTTGSQFDILVNNPGSAIDGTFGALAQGATLTAGGRRFQISYSGGASGHDVTLTDVTAANPTPPAPPPGSSSSSNCTTSDGTCQASNDGTTVTGEGSGALTLSQYPLDPVGNLSTGTGKYLDVQAGTGSAFTSVTVKDCNLKGGTTLEWWNPSANRGAGAWTPITPVPSYLGGPPPCVMATLDGSSVPSVSELTGTIFGVATTTSPVPTPTPTLPAQGYWLAGAGGGIFNFGNASFQGSAGATHPSSRVVGIAPTPAGGGYWLAEADGAVLPYGDATSYGSEAGRTLNKPIVGISSTPDGHGYWLVGADGGVFTFGDASPETLTGGKAGQISLGDLRLGAPIVGMAATADGHGYWLVGAAGGVFTFGDAGFHGSEGGKVLNKPMVGIVGTPDGHGYWLVGGDGGVFTFGDASPETLTGGKPGEISLGDVHLVAPIVGMAATSDGHGYWLVGADGGVFTFGDAGYHGSEGGTRLASRVVAIASS